MGPWQGHVAFLHGFKCGPDKNWCMLRLRPLRRQETSGFLSMCMDFLLWIMEGITCMLFDTFGQQPQHLTVCFAGNKLPASAQTSLEDPAMGESQALHGAWRTAR